MGNNAVMDVVIPIHAAGATIVLLLGAYNLRRRPKGDRIHRTVGRVWVVAMYWTVLSSFAIKKLNPGQFSWIHVLSLFTFVTLTIGLWAGITGRRRAHGRYMTGSYLGLCGAFIGAVAVPARQIPQWAVHEPLWLALAAAGCGVVALVVIVAGHRLRPRPALDPTAASGGAHTRPGLGYEQYPPMVDDRGGRIDRA